MAPRTRPEPLPTTFQLERDPTHHLTGPFLPQTPLDSLTPERSLSPALRRPLPPHLRVAPALRWAVQPASSFKLLLLPAVLYLNWQLLAPRLQPGAPNPFASCFFLSGHVPTSSPDDPRYAKTYHDLVFIAYHIVFWSFVRQLITRNLCRPIAKYFGLKKEAKLDRFGEQGYALLYFMIFGAWGYRIMGQLPTSWYRTEHFWIDYPHWDMKPQLKRYYLMQSAYWCQQLLVLILGLEKPRKDYHELIAHHFVTLWLVGWSYFVNLTLIGQAVYMSMDIPDSFLAFSKLLNYIQWHRAKVYSFVFFIGVWTYFRHYLNLRILWSVWFEIGLVPESAKQWSYANGTYLPRWMTYQVFIPLVLLQLLNLFWYFLMMRILARALVSVTAGDERSDDDDDGEEEEENTKED